MNVSGKNRKDQIKSLSIRKQIGRFSGLLLLFYLCIIVYFVLFSDSLGRTIGYRDYQFNLVPFQEIRRFITYRDSISVPVFVLNLLGNLVIFAPMAFLLPAIRMKKTGPVRILIYAFFLSLGIEVLQLVTKVGVFDVDDLILNTAGSMIGYIIYLLVKPVMLNQLTYLEDKNEASD